MKFSLKWGAPLVCCAVVVIGGLYIREVMDNGKLTRELQHARDDVEAKQALLQGLEEANQRLQTRLREVPVLTVTGEPPALPDVPAQRQTLNADWDLFEEEETTAVETPEPEVPLTPEQQAEEQARQEQREQERAEREQRRQEFRESMMVDLQARREFFSMINTDGLSPEYAEANTRLVEAMGEMQVKLQEIGNPELSREERRAIGRSMWQAGREISDLMDMQKEVLLYDYAELELGLDEARTQDFLNYMQTVETFTTMPRPGRGRR